MGQGRTLYRCVAGVEPNNLPQTEPTFIQPLWRNLQSSKIPAWIVPKTPSPEDSQILGVDVTGT